MLRGVEAGIGLDLGDDLLGTLLGRSLDGKNEYDVNGCKGNYTFGQLQHTSAFFVALV
ncbi:hypothetical protein DVDV_2054 [Desulfovibrio sp. DV]|nr:hypothetical protein DVDV_2054 [Desulfovibrio sp. DV]